MIVNNFRKTLEICPWVPFLLSQGMSRVTFVTDPQEKQLVPWLPLLFAHSHQNAEHPLPLASLQ